MKLGARKTIRGKPLERATPEPVSEWSALLDGELRERALAATEDILREIRSATANTAFPPTLTSGESGFALLFAEAARVQPRLAEPREAELRIGRAVEQLGEAPLGVDLFDGYPGVALSLELLRQAGHTVPSGSEEVDRALLGLARRFDELPPDEVHLDLIIGLAGSGTYLLSRLPRKTARAGLEHIVARFAERALEAEPGLAWLSPARGPAPFPSLPGRVFDLGLAHGVPSILVFLARALGRGVAQDTTRRLLAGGARWLLAQRRARDGALFDTYVPGSDAPLGENQLAPSPARNAWCYGDPGVAVSLLAAARALGDAALEADALAVAVHAARVRHDPSVVDACLCHGAAGLLHVFNRLYQATGSPALRTAALHWAEHTLSLRTPGQGLAGYLFHLGPLFSPPIQGEPGFVNGAAGVALALLSAASGTAPLWDGPLLLDLPARAPAPRTWEE